MAAQKGRGPAAQDRLRRGRHLRHRRGPALVNLAVERTEARRQSDAKTWRGLMRVRAVTEAA